MIPKHLHINKNKLQYIYCPVRLIPVHKRAEEMESTFSCDKTNI